MYIDSEIKEFPKAKVDKRFLAFLIDKFLLVTTPLAVGVLFIPVVVIFAMLGVPRLASIIVVSASMVATFLFILVWGNWLRVGHIGQTFGMSLMNLAIASDHSVFKTKLMNRWFFWANLSVKDMKNSWDGDEVEERADVQLWRGLAPWLLFPTIALLSSAVVFVVASIPVFIWNAVNGEVKFEGLNAELTLLVLSPILISFVVSELGSLFALGKEKRTLCDHFLGIKFVDVSGSRFAYSFKNRKDIKNLILGDLKESATQKI